MTGSATILWASRASHVLRVIELQVETFFESIGERCQRWIIAVHVRVANRAHGYVRGRELRQMTARAIFVTGEAGPRGIIVPMMAARATNGCVTLTGVPEL